MNRCEQVQGSLLAGEPLGKDDRLHVDSCEHCQQTMLMINHLAEAGKELAVAEDVDPGVTAAVRQAVMEKMEPRANRRWALAASALTAGVLGLVVMLIVMGQNTQPGAGPGSQSDFLAFMDVSVDNWGFENDEDMDLASDLLGAADSVNDEDYDWSMPLSDSYLALEEILEI